MNAAHLHMATNHIPVVGIPIALLLLAAGLRYRNELVTDFALTLTAGLALLTIPAYFSGHGAEEILEQIPHFEERIVETHLDAAKFAFALMIVSGASAGLALLLRSRRALQAGIVKALLVLLGISIASLAISANLGGQIRHPEIRKGFQLPVGHETEEAHEH